MNIEEYLSKFTNSTDNPSLKAMNYFMEEFGHPEKKLKVIHIAGTNGKGSCTEMLSNILINEGYTVGKFMSPHLLKYNERICIQNKPISNKKIEELINRIEPKIEKYNSINETKITLFELETTMAILYFYESNCDLAILEVGLGGLYDCTNIVNPLVSIITSIGYDHMNILGNSLFEIAKQKAGIIKQNSETIFALSDNKEVNKIIKNICKDKNNKLHLVSGNYFCNYSFDEKFQKFDYKKYKDIVINLKGKKQLINSGIVIECIEVLRNKMYTISEESIRIGLKTVIHKGRFEIINDNPLMIFDGAHNEPAIQNLIETIDMYYNNKEKVYLVSILKTKDYKTVLKILLKDSKSTFIFTSGNDKSRYVSKEELYNTAISYTNNEKIYKKELENAIQYVKEKYTKSVIFCIGSFYVYGTILQELKDYNNDKI